MNKNYFLRAGNIGAGIGFLIFLMSDLGISPIVLSNSVRDFFYNLFLAGAVDKFLKSIFPSVFQIIYVSDTWIILFPLLIFVLAGFIYGIIIYWIYKKIKFRGKRKWR